MALLSSSVPGIIGPGARIPVLRSMQAGAPPVQPFVSSCYCLLHASWRCELSVLTRSRLSHLRPKLAGKRLRYRFETTVSYSWLCGTGSPLLCPLEISLSRVRSVFIVLFVHPCGVMSEPRAQEDICVGGGCSFLTPGIRPESPAAVPGLMGFVERARAKGEEKSIV